MAAVVVYAMKDGKPLFFIGKESRFLSDLVGREDVRPLEIHDFKKPVSLEIMKRHFTEIAKDQSAKLGFRVQYDTPRQDKTTFIARTHLRYLPPTGVKYGIVKGGMEDVDGGNTEKTALREFNEECMNIPAIYLNKFQKAKSHNPTKETPLKGRDLFFLDITSLQESIETAKVGREEDHYGELFESNMMTYEETCKLRNNKLNFASKYAIEVFMRELSVPPCVAPAPKKVGGSSLRRKSHRRTLARKTTNK